MPKKVCFFLGSLQLGGIGKLSINLIEEFLKEGVEVDIFLMKDGGEYSDQVPDEVNIFCVEGSWIKRVSGFLKYLRAQRPDISMSARQRQDVINILCCLLTFGKVKPVVSVHTNLTAEMEFKGRGTNNMVDKIAARLYRFVDTFIAVSAGVADDFSKRTGVPRNKIEVIYNPVFKPYVDDGTISMKFTEFKARHSKYIIGVGRMSPQKDFETLIRAYARLPESVKHGLVIAGDGPLRPQLQKLIEELGLRDKVLLLGFVDNPLYYLKNADLFVLSSKWEGFGNVIVEALGVGTPVVSTNCLSGPAEILEDGKYGKLVEVGNVEQLSDAITLSLSEKPQPDRLIAKAADFDVKTIADKYLKLLLAN